MSDGVTIPVSEWLQSLKLEQYTDLFENNGLHVVSDLRILTDELLTGIGISLPGHRRRILALLQKSVSQDLPQEPAMERPVAMKRNKFRGAAASDTETLPPPMKPVFSPPPIPPRKGSAPPVRFSVNRPLLPTVTPEPMALDEPPTREVPDPRISPIQTSPPYQASLEGELDHDELPTLAVPPLPVKLHKLENKSPSGPHPRLPPRAPLVPPRTILLVTPKGPPPALEDPWLSETQPIPILLSVTPPKPLPRLPPRDPAPKPTIPAPRTLPAAPQWTDTMDLDLGSMYERTGEIDGVVLTGFRKTKFSSLISEDGVIEDGPNEYEDIMPTDSGLSAWRSTSSISSADTSSGTMDDGDQTPYQSTVFKAGWLEKSPPQGPYIFQKRWVKLDLYFVRYFDSEKDMYSKRFIKTSCISHVSPGKDQRFDVSTSNRNFVFRAESDAERNDWIKGFEFALEERRKRFPAGEQEVLDKSGYLEMKGWKPKLYVVVASEKVYIYKNAEDYMSGVGITVINMNLGNIKHTDKKSFDLTTPYRIFSFSAENEAEKGEWVEAMEQAVAGALSNLEVAKKIWSVEANQRCADCDAPNPDWASINLCVVICAKCAGQHRSLGPSISKVRSLKMDNKVWTEELIQLFLELGNGVSNKFWAANVPPSEAIISVSGTHERQTFITAKYREGKYRRYHQLFANPTELNKALCAAVTTSDLTETQALIFCGADVNCSSGDLLYPHPIQLAEQAGQRLQMEFLQQNKTSEIPGMVVGDPIHGQHYVTQPSVTHSGYIYKTSSMSKPVTDRKGREEFSRRWCVLNDGVLSYYENVHSSSPNGEIKMSEIACLAVIPPDTHGFDFTFEIYTSERLYLFATDTADEARDWVKSITKCLLPPKADELLTYDFDRVGSLQYKGGRTLEHVMLGWFCLCKTNLYMYREDSDTLEVINLKKLSELSIKDKEMILVQKGRIVFIIMERKLYFPGWESAIKTASRTSGDTLSEQQLTHSDVPFIVDKCIGYISLHGVGSEGIYRKSGQSSKTTSLLEALKKDARNVVLKVDDHHVDNVSDTLKRFFRDVGEGIFAEHCLNWLIVTGFEDTSEKIQQYKTLLQDLPPVNRATLKALIGHLHCIQHFSARNQMNVHNLAIVFGPTLFQTVGQSYKPGRVVEDLITHYLPIFEVGQQELEKELNLITMANSETNGNQMRPGCKTVGTDFICTVYLGEKKPEMEQIVQIPVNMTAQDLTKTLLDRRNIRSKEGEHWSCYEVEESQELERPLHASENVLPIFHSESSSRSHLVVKKNLHMEAMLRYVNTRVGESKHGTMRYREGRIKLANHLGIVSAFSDRYFMLNSSMLRMYKDVRTHKAEKEWPVKSLLVYLGIKKKFRPPSSWGFTVIYKKDRQERTHWYACCDSEAEMIQWFAALTYVQHGSLLPIQASTSQTRQSQLDSKFGSLIPIRGNENDMRKSIAAFSTDTVFGEV